MIIRRSYKNCPHCSSSNLLGPYTNSPQGNIEEMIWWIMCEDCPCAMFVNTKKEEVLRKYWNTRDGEKYEENYSNNTF